MNDETSNRLLEDALKLSDVDRAEIAGSLIESLDTPFDEGAEAAWSVEIAQRADELDRGAVNTATWPVARRQILGDASS